MNGDVGAKKIIKRNFSKVKFVQFRSSYILKDYDTNSDFQIKFNFKQNAICKFQKNIGT